MSLRTFHLLFILVVVAALVGLGLMLGSSSAISEEQRPVYSWISYGAALVLGPYLFWFLRKTRGLHSDSEDSAQP